MVHKAPQLLVPFINEVFGRNYPDDSEIIRFNSEHEGHKGTIIDDSVFRLQSKIYHVECQSTPDSSMVVRMIEYDFAIARFIAERLEPIGIILEDCVICGGKKSFSMKQSGAFSFRR
jgi:hypothetical protein